MQIANWERKSDWLSQREQWAIRTAIEDEDEEEDEDEAGTGSLVAL